MLMRASSGFTLIESLTVLAIVAALASLAYPSFAKQVRKSHRSDAIVRLAMLQLAEERWRSGHASYGSLADTGTVVQTGDNLYRLSVSDADSVGYVAVAEAQGQQTRDVDCRFLRLTVQGGNTIRASGPDAAVANPPALNDRCWNR